MGKRSAESATSRQRNRAVRLIFEQKNGRIKLVSTQRVNMIAPPPQALTSERVSRGSWFELRDQQDRPVYRRVIENPLQDIEVVADDPAQPLQRVRVEQARSAFFLIVPDITGARRLALNQEPRQIVRAASAQRGKSARKPDEPTSVEFDFSNIDE
ncbi:MAG: hypothetical protein ICV60_23685 [Pyrinomonadaceae bacterium]|nr:hypothetical protein [Pyrinomonadaceae bacterium]